MSKATEAIDAALENYGDHGLKVDTYEDGKVIMPEIFVSIYSKEIDKNVAREICKALAGEGLDNVGVKTRYDEYSRDYYRKVKLGLGTDIVVLLPEVKVESVALKKATLSLDIGASEKLTTTIKPDDAKDKTVKWSVDKPAIATVNAGTVNAIAEGTAVVTVKSADGNKESKCTVTVKKPVIPVTGVTISPKTADIKVGETKQLSSVVAPANADDKTVTYTSKAQGVASVDNKGLITANTAGSATIVVSTVDGEKKDECVVTVTVPEPEPEPEPEE